MSRLLRNLYYLNCRANFFRKSVQLVNNRTWRTLVEPICSTQNTIPVINNRGLVTKIEAREKPKSLEERVNVLRNEFATNGVVNQELLMQAIDALKVGVEFPEDQSLFLIESCADRLPTQTTAQRLEIFQRIWNFLGKSDSLTKNHFLAALRVYRENHCDSLDHRQFLESCPFKNDITMYEGLVRMSCEVGNIKQTTEILGEMKEKGFPLTVSIFNALILGHSRRKDLKSAEAVLETMSAANLGANSETFTNLVVAFIENGNEANAERILKQHGNGLSPGQVKVVVKVAAVHGKEKLVQEAINSLPGDFVPQNMIPLDFRNLCTELVYAGQQDAAFLVVNSFPSPNFNENQDVDNFASFLIYDLIKSGADLHKTIAFCKDLVASNRNTRALHVACEIALRRNPDEGLFYLEELAKVEPLRPQYFWPLILNDFRKRGEMGLLNVVKKMVSFNVEVDFETLSLYILPRLSITLKKPQKAIKTLEDCGVKTSQTLTPIVSHLIFQQRLEDIDSLAKLYQSKLDTEQFVYPLSNLFSSLRTVKTFQKFARTMAVLQSKSQNPSFDLAGQFLLEVLTNPKLKNDFGVLQKLLEELKLRGLTVSTAAADVLNGHFTKFEEDKAATSASAIVQNLANKKLSLPAAELFNSNITHPRDMSLEELECHLVELESKGLNSRGVLRRLLQLCVREGKLDRAVEVKSRCAELKVEMSPGMMATIFDLNVKLKDVKGAEEALMDIGKLYPGFLLDEHKIIDYAALLAENGRLDDAKRILKKRAATSKIKGGDYVLKNIWQLLTNVATYSAQTSLEKNEAHGFLTFIQQLGYCSYHNTLLGPIIREHILKNDVKSAFGEFKRIVEKFKKTPLQLELISLLVKITNGVDLEKFNVSTDEAKSMLQEIITLTSGVHGSANANISLIVAIAESGTENQLRKLLIDPNFRFNQELLLKNCEHLSNAGKIKTLVKLARASRGLGHAIQEQNLYNILLNSFVKENNYLAALELFERLESDDDFKITPAFLTNLVDLLRVNNVEIPSQVALRAKLS